MASKFDKEKSTGGKSASKSLKDTPKKTSSKSKKQMEDGENDEEDEDDKIEDVDTPKVNAKNATKSSKKSSSDDDDEDEGDDVDEVDEWEKPEEEDTWDPDFEEFDLPKSKAKKTTGGAKKGKEEDDLGVDDEFKDMDLFNDRGFDDDEEDF